MRLKEQTPIKRPRRPFTWLRVKDFLSKLSPNEFGELKDHILKPGLIKPVKEGTAMMPLRAQFTEWLKACNERFARFSGSQFSSHELPGEDRVLTAVKRLCLDCRKREVKARQRYCPHCARNRKRESKRCHMRLKRGLDVEKLANSPIGAEALTKPERQGGYHHPKTPILESVFSTQQANANAR